MDDHYIKEEQEIEERKKKNNRNIQTYDVRNNFAEVDYREYYDYSNNQDIPNNIHNNHINDIDFTNPNLQYEDLLRLDENVSHPLSPYYLSILNEEKITHRILANLKDDMKVCMICFDEFEVDQPFIRIPCIHMFHSNEIKHWFEKNKTCPVCRADIEVLLKNSI